MAEAPAEAAVNRNVSYYRRLRDKLHELLGGGCALCGSKLRLAVDHVDGRDYLVRGLSSHRRMRRYLDEYEAGVRLRLLCWDCDPERNGGKLMREPEPKVRDTPF